MPYQVLINDVDLATIDVHPEEVTDWYGAPRRSFASLRIPGRMGVVLTAEPEVSERVLRIRCLVQPFAHTTTARLAAEDNLKAAAMRGLVQVIADDGTNPPRVIDGVCEGITIAPRVHPVVGVASVADIDIKCPDASWRAVAGSIVGFTTTAVGVPLGTAPSGGLVRIVAPAWSANVQDPVLTYASASGITLATMTFTVTLVAGLDYLEIDLDRLSVTKYASGVSSNGLSLLTAGDFFGLDPNDGDIIAGKWASLKATATVGTPTGAWYGHRRYL